MLPSSLLMLPFNTSHRIRGLNNLLACYRTHYHIKTGLRANVLLITLLFAQNINWRCLPFGRKNWKISAGNQMGHKISGNSERYSSFPVRNGNLENSLPFVHLSQRTSKVITKLLQFMLEGPQPYITFSFTLTLLVE